MPHHVIVVGGGFAGLWATRALASDTVTVTLIDRRNHHLFQPLLYQVATAGLSAPDIAAPLRHLLRGQRNCEVVLGDVTGIDAEHKTVSLSDGRKLAYDSLVLASGATHAYFGHEEWSENAPGLKTIEDALDIRRRVLLAFENAEAAQTSQERAACLTFAIVGAGCRHAPDGGKVSASCPSLGSVHGQRRQQIRGMQSVCSPTTTRRLSVRSASCSESRSCVKNWLRLLAAAAAMATCWPVSSKTG